jgi:hypothetical protein
MNQRHRALSLWASLLAGCPELPWGAGIATDPPPKASFVDNGLVLALSPSELTYAAAELSQRLEEDFGAAPPALGGTLLLDDPRPPPGAPAELKIQWGDLAVTPVAATLEPLGASIALALVADLGTADLQVTREGWPSCMVSLGNARLTVWGEVAIDSDKLGQIKAPVVPVESEVMRAPETAYSSCWTLDEDALALVIDAWLAAVGESILSRAADTVATHLPAALGVELALGAELRMEAEGGSSSTASLWVRAPALPAGTLASNVDGALVVPYSVRVSATQHACVPVLEELSVAKKSIPAVPLASGTIMVSGQVVRQAVRAIWKAGALCGDLPNHDPAIDLESLGHRVSLRVWPEDAPTVEIAEVDGEPYLEVETGTLAFELYTERDGARVRLVTLSAKATLEGKLWVDEQGRVLWERSNVEVWEATVRDAGLVSIADPEVAKDVAAEVVEELATRLVGTGALWTLPPLPGPEGLTSVSVAGGFLVFAR